MLFRSELEGDKPIIVDNANPERLSVTHDHLLPILVNAINELSEELDILKEKVRVLESK